MGHSPGELIELLTAGATTTDRAAVRAAIHLLTFTQLPHLRGFAGTGAAVEHAMHDRHLAEQTHLHRVVGDVGEWCGLAHGGEECVALQPGAIDVDEQEIAVGQRVDVRRIGEPVRIGEAMVDHAQLQLRLRGGGHGGEAGRRDGQHGG